MAFDPISWAIGYGLTKILNSLFTSDLSSKLRAAVNEWVQKLPDGFNLYPEALFPNQDQPHDPISEPERNKLSFILHEEKIPTADEWQSALLEQWQEIKTELGNDAQEFFRRTIDEVLPHIATLATKLEKTCRHDREMFQVTVIEELGKISSDVAMMKDIVVKNRQLNETKRWKKIPSEWFPIPDGAENSWTDFYGQQFLVSMYRTYKDIGYSDFIALLNLHHSHIPNGSGGKRMTLGFFIFTGEARFLGNLRVQVSKHLKSILDKQQSPWYQTISSLSTEWCAKWELPIQPKITPCRFLFDPDQYIINISVSKECSLGKLVVKKNMNISDALIAVVKLIRSNNSVIHIDFQYFHPAMMKMIIGMQISGNIEFDRILINVDNSTDWDYKFEILETVFN